MKLQKALAVVGAGVVLFAASDAVTYAATGSSLIMGRINQATSATTIQNTSTGSALRLITASTLTPPMVVNGKGKVVNLYADRAATADNATKLGGLSVAQIKTAAKGAPGTPGTPGANGDPGDPGPRPAGLIWVAQSGGQFTSVSAALAAITDNGPAHPYLIKVAPGAYTESGSVVLKDRVDIEGSGQDVTTITCACGSDTDPVFDGSSAVFQVTGPGVHVGIRNLTISNTGNNLTYSTGFVTKTTDPGDVTLDAVTITATGGTSYNSYHVGIYNYFSSPAMSNVTATATGGTTNHGIRNDFGSPTITNVTSTATGGTDSVGIYNNESSPTMTNVTSTATGIGSGDGTGTGIYNYMSSPTMTNVTSKATGGTDSIGIRNEFSSSPTMRGGSAIGSGGSGTNTGILNSSSSPTYDTVTAAGTGGTQGRGIVNANNATVTLANVTATGSGGSINQNWGIDNSTASTMTIRDSFVTGTPNSIHNNGSTVNVANTRLNGAVFGIMTCVGAYAADTFAALNTSCQ
jgi:hypothetical protein